MTNTIEPIYADDGSILTMKETREDGTVWYNATLYLAHYNTIFPHWFRLKKVKQTVERLEKSFGVQVDHTMAQYKGKHTCFLRGTWIRDAFAEYMVSYVGQKSKHVLAEAVVQESLARREDGEREVKTPTGPIDVVTKTHVIEVKRGKHWKEAIGQVMVDRLHYPGHLARIHFFDASPTDRRHIEWACSAYQIAVTYENS